MSRTEPRFRWLQAAPLLCLAALATAQDPRESAEPRDDGKTTTATEVELKLPEFTSGKPRFRKLIYGLDEVKPVVWVVVDGTDIYCDIDRDGDLTDPDEKQSFAEKQAHFVGGGIEVWFIKTALKSSYQGILQGRTFPPSGPSQEKASVYHIAGPFKLLQGTINNRLGQKMDNVLYYVEIGTEYPGVVRTAIRYACLKQPVVPELTIHYEDGTTDFQPLDRKC